MATQQLVLKDGTRAKVKMGDSVIGYITSLTIDATYNIVDANQLGSMFPIEQHTMSYKATVNAEFFLDTLINHRFTEKDAHGNIISTANRYDFTTKIGFENFLKAGANKFNIAIYADDTSNYADWLKKSEQAIGNSLLFKIDNLMIQSESIRIQQGQLITMSSSFVTTDPILNHTALTAI